MSKSLKDKSINGIGWSAADAFMGNGVTFLVGIVLARLLSPSEYGLIGIVTIFTTILTGIVDSGFSNALIRKIKVQNEDYNTMFITNMGMSFVLFVLLYVFSPAIAVFFERPQLVNLTRVMGLILIFQALSITQVTVLTKRIDFKTKAKASLIAATISGIAGVFMAFAGFGVWSLVGLHLSNKLVFTICLWIYNKWIPSFRFSIDSFRYMWGFGWKLMLTGIINNIWNQLYQVVVGKCYSPATLGQYSRSREYANLFSSNFTAIIQRVSFPALAEIQEDKERMVVAYRKVIKLSMFITAICMISMGAMAEPLIYCLIGPQWYQAATFLPLICVSLSLYPLHAINLNMLQVQGRSDIMLELEIVKKILAIVPLCLGVFVNIYWMLIGSIFYGIICVFLNTYYTGKHLGYSAWMQLKDVIPFYAVAFLVAIPVFLMKYIPIADWVILPMQIFADIALLFIICHLIKLNEYKELISIIKSYMTKIIKKINDSKTFCYRR